VKQAQDHFNITSKTDSRPQLKRTRTAGAENLGRPAVGCPNNVTLVSSPLKSERFAAL